MENQLSSEDYLLVETNMLGVPLSVFTLKPGYIRFMRRVGLSIFFIGVVALVFAIVSFFRFKSDNGFDSFVLAWLPALYAMFQGGLIYRIEVNRARRMRVIICEQGLLYVTHRIKRDVVEVVRWKDVLDVKKEFIGKSYYLARCGGMPITLSSNFQNLDELVAAIREQSEMEEAIGHSRRTMYPHRPYKYRLESRDQSR